MILPKEFYLEPDVVSLSKRLLGKFLFTRLEEGIITGGMISETEAYHGPEDRASHAYKGRRTKRTEIIFHEGGVCYIYLCYGIHHLINVVTNHAGIPHAILIRALIPSIGIDLMMKRRNKLQLDRSLTLGPGSVAQALGVSLIHNGESLSGPNIWIEDRGINFPEDHILAGPRIGVDYAGEDALLPWRFQIKNPPALL